MSTLQLPLAFHELPASARGKAPPAVEYAAIPYGPAKGGTVQPVLTGRKLLTPCIDLNSYKCRAVIDWIEIEIKTFSSHRAINLQPAIARMLKARGSCSTLFVFGPRRQIGHKGHTFILRFQEPRPQELTHVLKAIDDRYNLETPNLGALRIMAIEVSVDFYAKTNDASDEFEIELSRWKMVDVLRRHLKPGPLLTDRDRGFPRFYDDTTSRTKVTYFVDPRVSGLPPNLQVLARRLRLNRSDLVALNLNNHSQAEVDMTSWIGPKNFHVMLRTMNKVTDRRDPVRGTSSDLPISKRRARLEMTLQGKPDEVGGHGALKLERLGNLKGFAFKSIRRVAFEFYLPTFGEECDGAMLEIPLRANEERVFSRSGVYGLDRFHRAIQLVNEARISKGETGVPFVRLGKKGRLVSWMDMNQKIDRALKKLGKDWQNFL